MADVFKQDDDTLLELELAAEQRATTPLRGPLAKVLALLTALWPGDDAPAARKQAVLRRLNTDAVLSPLGEVERQLMRDALDALRHGVSQGNAMLATRVRAPEGLPADLTQTIKASGVAMRSHVAKGKKLLSEADTLDDAQAAVAVISAGVNRVSNTARWATNRAANEGINHVAEVTPDTVLIWRAERDACLHCLAYQGQIRKRGGYPKGLTYAAKPLNHNPVAQPPLHPNCRCTQWAVSKEVAGPLVTSLVREAQRSVLRGFSLSSESEKARVDAADRLLKTGVTAPASVKKYARDAIKRRAFTRGRKFPGGR